jgi:hypothetical protein
MEISRDDLVIILQALSTLEAAFMVTGKGVTGEFLYWKSVEKAQAIVIKALSDDE